MKTIPTKMIVLAAGKGSRMKSNKPKVLHEVCGKPMLQHIVNEGRKAGIKNIYVVIGHGAEEVREAIKGVDHFIVQEEQLGTAHAIKTALQTVPTEKANVLIVPGDTPLITAKTLTKIINKKNGHKDETVMATVKMENPFGYGRIIVDKKTNCVKEIKEEKDATLKERKITTVNTGIYVFDIESLKKTVERINNNNKQKEYYLTDAIGLLHKDGKRIYQYLIDDCDEVQGVNDRSQLATVTQVMQKRINKKHMQSGVTMIDPASVHIDSTVEMGEDIIIYPNVIIKGETSIGGGTQIHTGTELENAVIGTGAVIRQSIIRDSVIRNNVTIGPFAHIRPNTIIENEAKIGNFVELKTAHIGKKSKVGHLTYLGDAVLGEEVNIGCGVVTANYDGENKFRTTINNKAFIGSNANLIAPITIGKGALVAAGSTITKDVPENGMGIARERQTNKERKKN